MKKLVALLLILALVLLLTACSVKVERDQLKGEGSMFVIVEQAATWCVVYHKETFVMYTVSNGVYNFGTFTVLLNADGLPMTWKGR